MIAVSGWFKSRVNAADIWLAAERRAICSGSLRNFSMREAGLWALESLCHERVLFASANSIGKPKSGDRRPQSESCLFFATRPCRKNCAGHQSRFRADLDLARRSGTPTRATGIQAGGSLAGNVSIRLIRTSSSSTAVVSISRVSWALARLL
jgi:hypothetical protein